MKEDREILAAAAERSTSFKTSDDRLIDILTFRGAIIIQLIGGFERSLTVAAR